MSTAPVPDAAYRARLLAARAAAALAWDRAAACANLVDTASHALQQAMAEAHVAQREAERVEAES